MTRVQIGFLSVLTIYLAVACACAAESVSKPEPPSDKNLVITFSEQDIREFYDEHREKLFVTSARVRVKAILAPTLETAAEARQRAAAGEDFDELIAEYSVPYIAEHGKQRHVNKQVDFQWMDQEEFWRADKPTGPLSRLEVGDVSKPHSYPARGPEFAVLKIVAKRDGTTAPLEEVRDNIYSRLWDELADTSILQEVRLEKNPWCGTCRAGRNVNGQLWHRAQHYLERGQQRQGISACLLALREHRLEPQLGGPHANENGSYPEEQYLIDHGMDLVRYYVGVMDRALRGHRVCLPDGLHLRVRRIKDERVVPALIRLVANRGRWSGPAALSLGMIKAESAAPALKDMLSDRHLSIAELQWSGGEKRAVYAEYYLRPRARDALRRMGIDPGEVKTIVGKLAGDELPDHRW